MRRPYGMAYSPSLISAFDARDRLDGAWLQEKEGDYARGGGPPPPPNRGRSALNTQVTRWNQIMRRLQQWGISRNTLRNEQAQIIPRPRPVIQGRGQRRRIERLVTARNQPDIQAVDPRSGRRINIEVDTNRRDLQRHQREVIGNDPGARSVFLLIDPRSGRTLEKHVYDPLTRRTTVSAQDLRPRDVLDFDH